jgi:hypothetical protein
MLSRLIVVTILLVSVAACATVQSARDLRLIPLTSQSPELQARDIAACNDAAWDAVTAAPLHSEGSSTPSAGIAAAAIAGGAAIGAGAALAVGAPFGWLLGNIAAPFGGQAILHAATSRSAAGSTDVTSLPDYVATYRQCLKQRGYRVR